MDRKGYYGEFGGAFLPEILIQTFPVLPTCLLMAFLAASI